LDKTARLIKKSTCKAVIISGGEPSLHPEIVDIMKFLKKELPKCMITLASNGQFLQNTELTDKLISCCDSIQITSDLRYYPNPIKHIYRLKKISPKIATEDHILSVAAYGRALDNNIKSEGYEKMSPFCFNLRSIIKRSGKSFVEACQIMEGRHKFCFWAINPDGGVSISESMCCPTVGSINDSVKELTKNISEFRCNQCVYAKALIEEGGAYKEVLI